MYDVTLEILCKNPPIFSYYFPALNSYIPMMFCGRMSEPPVDTMVLVGTLGTTVVPTGYHSIPPHTTGTMVYHWVPQCTTRGYHSIPLGTTEPGVPWYVWVPLGTTVHHSNIGYHGTTGYHSVTQCPTVHLGAMRYHMVHGVPLDTTVSLGITVYHRVPQCTS